MAEAKKKDVPVEKTVTVFEERIQLTLTRAEAQTLQIIMHHIGGSPNDTRRMHADAIREVLSDAGIHTIWSSEDNYPLLRDQDGCTARLSFKRDEKETLNG